MQDHPRCVLLPPSSRSRDSGRRGRLLVSLGVLCAMLTLARGSFAQTTDTAAEAKLHYEEGTKAYSLADFPRAITEFKAAYNAKPEPTLLFNIAQSYRLAGDLNQALFFYRSYLRNKPDALNRRDVDRRIKELEKQVADAKAGVVAAPAAGAAGPAGTVSPAPATTPAAVGTPTAPPATPPAQVLAPAPVQPLPSAATAVQPPPMGPTPAMPPPAVQPATATAVAVAPAGDAPVEESSPFYKRWWFWTGVGVVALVSIAAAASARQSVPHDDFGGPFSVKY